ncbi:hypothetical protein C5L31_000797 [Secundilactobacillus malefermentans]|uniref:Exonuclease SbcC n=1 Tax=Secundilactobacillus malefermentans TaxID=176292 RepID=A0A4R5NT22_9LACO|nr:hypothetical protein [Secundilactobacillus malefermentans]KRM59615.1 hypothetical protein FD44_GL001238 [Secundilactobacillus malefermentans DSM 5705 = KCTC 3548]TDG80431.1 hypothetical protein C5L31_000797 [Secundilactobacillus malefermentans]
MDNQGQVTENNANQSDVQLNGEISQKIEYLTTLQTAIADKHDLKAYELLDTTRFGKLIKKTRTSTRPTGLEKLVDDLHPELSHYLSHHLIDYLGKTYPFFYYDEYKLGEFQIYFGNWWNRRQFGTLDVLNIAFKFDEDEFDKLKTGFELETENKRYNSSRIEEISASNTDLQKLIDDQTNRDQRKEQLRAQLKENGQKSTLPWDSGKVKDERQVIIDQLSTLADEDEAALDANNTIKENDEQILALSKEDTIINYEMQSIKKTFEDFSRFNQRNQSLYTDYLNSLVGEARVNADD